MTSSLLLLPVPRRLTLTGGTVTLAHGRLILLDSAEPGQLFLAARQLQTTLQKSAGVRWDIAAGTAVPAEAVGVVLRIVPGAVAHREGYQLTVADGRIDVVAGTAAGIFYGVQTLRQILEQTGAGLPTLRCTDWPDFPNRGVMLDISRNKVPTLDTLRHLIDLLSTWKVNQLQLYVEHTFAYRSHPVVWADASPLSAEDMLTLDRYCAERHMELVPNQNSFGHLTPWLVHAEYRHLAEAPDGYESHGRRYADPYGLQPGPASLDFLRSLFDELLPNFSSRQFNVGFDETVDLGQGRSADLVAAKGTGRVYLDFLLDVYREVKARGRTMQFWGDIIVNYPDLVAQLPRDLIALEWGYEAHHPFDEHGALFAASGVPFYVCPGTSSWNTIAGRTANAIGNLRSAAENGLKHGAVGFLNTDWGDYGHWQPLPISYLGLAYGAAVSWGVAANRDLDLAAALSQFVFRDRSGIMGQLAYDLGNVYLATGVFPHNSTIFFRILQADEQGVLQFVERNQVAAPMDKLRAALVEIDTIMARLPQADMDRPDAELVMREFVWAGNMLRHACWRGVCLLTRARGAENPNLRRQLHEDSAALIAEFHDIWHARNRTGGYQDSLARLEKMRAAYMM